MVKDPLILVVDDDALVLEAIGVGLRAAGYQVILAVSGKEALDIARSNKKPDLSILDIHMPDISGIEIAAEMKEIGVPFIFLSASNDRNIVKKAVSAGALGYMVKPFSVQQIAPAIEAALERAHDFKKLEDAQDHLNKALASGRETSVAVGLIMERFRLGEEEAFEILRSNARNQRCSIGDIANDIVSSIISINTLMKRA
ncbi:MAG: response regulator [Gammaproteobacteria bacterium]|nr:response regulator [Gammaproteobacteria bacterium]MDH5594215.1 response regulator [Gammaproteobacteria bacterium]MDH5614769.1 response regulator [Gammaproteobacteria bacterium]